ncbi:MAG: hypothetical protein Tsb009_00550 [Planctomycetaceae bacterium]
MKTLLLKLWNDEDGFIVSAELVLVSTITVLSMLVGLSELSNSINNELYDVSDAFGSVNQWDSYWNEVNNRSNDWSNTNTDNRWDVIAND